MTFSHTSVTQLLGAIRNVGRDNQRGGYSRFTFAPAELELREWFVAEARRRSMDVEIDRNGLIWAWRAGAGGSLENAIVTGSHLDSVPGGGAFDGPLGIASALKAVDLLDARGVVADRPLAVVAFPEEEGGRFGLACLGSQLMTGKVSPDRARNLRDDDGNTYADAFARAGLDPVHMGRDDEALGRVAAFVELHVEQGRSLVHTGDAVGVASAIWPHGRWRLDFCGEANHAGATVMEDRRDPMQAYAATVLASRRLASDAGARATFGRLEVEPGGTNAIPSRVRAWLDARAADEGTLDRLVDNVIAAAQAEAGLDGTTVELTTESVSPAVEFDAALRDRLATLLDAPVLPTGAGHDAGVLSAHIPTAMLFVRNPTGISHSPAEFAEDADCEAGIVALTTVVRELAT